MIDNLSFLAPLYILLVVLSKGVHMTRTAMEVVDGLARDGTSLAVGVAGGLFIAEQFGKAMLRNDERRAEEDRVTQSLSFGCYLSAGNSRIRGEIENLAIAFLYQGTRLEVKSRDIIRIHRPEEKPTCHISLTDGSSFRDVTLLSKIVVQTTGGDIKLDSNASGGWRELYGISFGERRLVEAKREEERKKEQRRHEAQAALRRRVLREEAQLKRDIEAQNELRAARQTKRLKQERRERLVPWIQGTIGLVMLCVAGLFLAWIQLQP